MAMAAAATTSVVINRAAGIMIQQQQQQQQGVVAMSYGSFCSGRLSSSCTHLSGGNMCREEEVQRRRARRGSAAAAGRLRIRMQQSSSPSVFSSDQVCCQRWCSDLSKRKVAESGSEIGNWGFPLIRREPFRSRHLK
ncbi:unnamed protein product [Sphagnum balticum]